MQTRAEFILAQRHINKDLHPATIMFFEWVADGTTYMVPKVHYNLAGIWFRRKVVNIEQMVRSADFFTPNVDGLRDVKNCFEVANLQHAEHDITSDYAVSIDKHIRYFIDITGKIELLPFHRDQRLYFRVQPEGLYSKTATAVYYQQFRAGYLNGSEGYRLVNAAGKQCVELSYGIIERAHTERVHDAKVRIVIPQGRFIERLSLEDQPKLIWHEKEDSTGTHYAPNLADFPELYMGHAQ